MRRSAASCLMVLALLAACSAPATPTSYRTPDNASAQRSTVEPSRTLVMVVQVEPKTFTSRVSIGGGRDGGKSVFNAKLVTRDERELPHPHLAEALPQLNTDTWKVFPDGKMETTYQLRPNLTWHDGTPLTAEDFVFTRRVVTDPTSTVFTLTAEDRQIEEVVALDPRTVVFRWRGTYREAGMLAYDPLPRHLLQTAYEQDDPGTFASHPYWSTEYVHLGPYRMQRWEPAAFIEATAFDGHALGRPRIDRVKLIWSADPNVSVTYLLSGEAHIAVDGGISFQTVSTLRREWSGGRGGTVLLSPTQVRYLQTQFRPEYARPAALIDPRVRKALAHAMDKPTLADVLLEGEGNAAETFIPPLVEAYGALDRVLVKYPYDLRRTEQLLAEAGLSRGADGAYSAPGEGRFGLELRARAGQEEQEATILVDGWQRAGVDASLRIVSAAQTADQEFRSTFPGMAVAFTSMGGDGSMNKFISSAIPRPSNRWTGNNRGGWSNPEFDRLHESFNGALDAQTSSRLLVRAMQLLSEELPAIPLYYSYEVAAHVSQLRGPQLIAPESTPYSNLYRWEWQT